jgi:hypothetical protein
MIKNGIREEEKRTKPIISLTEEEEDRELNCGHTKANC